jgi:hypothetical protein
MPSFFNPIAVALPMEEHFQYPLANFKEARRLPSSLACPECGGQFAVYVPLGLPANDLQEVWGDLAGMLAATCGSHPPVIQRQ